MTDTGLDLWRQPRPSDPGERELENCRRRYLLGNWSGLADGLIYCSGRPVRGWNLPVPEWLSEALAEAGIAERLAVGRPVEPELFRQLWPPLVAHLKTIRTGKMGRFSRWWVRWEQDMTDFERYSELDDIRGRVRQESRAAVHYLEGLPQSESVEDRLRFMRDNVDLSSGAVHYAERTAAALLSSSSDTAVSVSAMLGSAVRVREVTATEPWRYNLGPLATMWYGQRDARRRADDSLDGWRGRAGGALED